MKYRPFFFFLKKKYSFKIFCVSLVCAVMFIVHFWFSFRPSLSFAQLCQCSVNLICSKTQLLDQLILWIVSFVCIPLTPGFVFCYHHSCNLLGFGLICSCFQNSWVTSLGHSVCSFWFLSVDNWGLQIPSQACS